MKKLGMLLLIVVIAGFCYFMFNNNKTATSDKPVFKIGIILPITGNLAQIGDISQILVGKIREEVKESPLDVQLVVEDNLTSVKNSVIQANKLINADKVNALFSMFTNFSTVVTPITNNHKILHVCVANDCDVASGQLNFANWQQNDVSAKKVIELLKQKNAKKIVIFTLEHTGYILISDALKKELDENDIAYEEFNFYPEERDFASIVDKASKIENVDYWFLNTMSPAIELIRKKMLEKNIDIPITGIQSFGTAEMPELFKGFEYVDAAKVNKETKDYVAARTSSTNITIPAYAYDSIKMIIKAAEDFYVQNGRVPTSEEMAESFLKMENYQGVVGNLYISPKRIIYSDTIITKVE